MHAEKRNRDFKSKQVRKHNQEAFATSKEIMKVLDLMPSSKAEDRPGSSTCKSTNVAPNVDKTDLVNIKLTVLRLLRDNKRMAFDERRRSNPLLACFRR